MARRVKIIGVVVVLGGIGLFAVREAYFYLAILRPGVGKMIEVAEAGDPVVQTELGMLYQQGGIPRRVSERSRFFVGIMPDPSKSVFWYRRAAEQGYAEAEIFLSLSYAGGIGVQRDDVQVVRWMRRAAEHGSADGQMMLGRMFDKGYNGVVRDDVQAVKWYRAAAESGQVVAQRLLGECYASGRGVQQDDLQAVAWYKKASDQGDVEAQKHLRETRAQGRGVAR